MKPEDVINQFKPVLQEFFKKENAKWQSFEPGKDSVHVGWPAFDEHEVLSTLNALLQGRLSSGPFVKEFEKQYAHFNGIKHAVAVNSGTSANILAINILIQAGKLKPGQEVILPAATFASVASPILQQQCIPVYVDVEKDTHNIDPAEVEKAISDKTGLIMPVHSFGNPADMKAINEIAEKRNLPVLEDCCESHGAEINNKKVGSFSTISTLSFFVAHNMTTGEGGMVFSDDESLIDLARSLREFGRVTDGERFPYVNDQLKQYDKRYVFRHVGFNVRMADPTAAFGIAQLAKLNDYNEIRRSNAKFYTDKLKKFNHLIQLPVERPNTKHTYYGYVIAIKDKNIERNKFVEFLEKRKIETRPFMAGSLPDQPAFINQPKRVVGELPVSGWLRDQSFFVGCHPFVDQQRLQFVVDSITEFLENKA